MPNRTMQIEKKNPWWKFEPSDLHLKQTEHNHVVVK